MIHLDLNGNWKLKKTSDSEWLDTNVPGSVFKTLLENNLIEDPFYGDNDETAKKAADYDYEYKRIFMATEELLACKNIILFFNGLDTLCHIFINGKQTLYCDNMHRTYELNVKKILQKGENEIRIVFYSPTKYIKEKQKQSSLWGASECMEGFPHIRKGHYMFGWDWGPQVPDIGIWRSLSIKGYEAGKIDDVYITQNHTDSCVTLSIRARVERFINKSLTFKLEVLSPDQTCIQRNIYFSGVEITETIEIINPNLWWPNGLGGQPLYTVKIFLMDGETCIDEKYFKIGLRTIKILQEKDEWGESFAFSVNKTPLFAMGADYVPEDNLLSRCSYQKTEKLLSDCVKANFNCIRVWGGGVYPEDYFYDLCDKLGLIVWQDFMYACGVYEMNEDFEKNICLEVIDNVKRIRHHASLGLWCGNNEMEEGWENWNFPKTSKLRTDYIKQFEVLFPEIMKEYDPETFYWPSSPSSGGSFDIPNDENRGDVHYWDVWHGQKPFTDYRKYHFRFVSEFGFQSFPCLKTIESFTKPDDRNIFSYVMERHQKNPSANGKILYYLSDTFQYPKDFENLLYVSQLLQAAALKYGVEFWRQNRGRCMGAIYWQLNDCWPVASWASIDYFGRWKALHYFAKAFFAPLLISAREDKKTVVLYICNESLNDVSGTASWRLIKNNGDILSSGFCKATAEKLSAKQIIALDYSEILSNSRLLRQCCLEYEFTANGSIVSQGSVLFTKPKHFEYLNPHITFLVQENENEFVISLKSNSFAQYVEILSDKYDLFLSDNYFDLSPCRPKTVTVKKSNLSENLNKEFFQKSLKIKSLFNTY